MNYPRLLLIAAAFLTIACHSSRRSNKSASSKVINLDTLTITPKDKSGVYKESRKREFDILHTKLELSFDPPNLLLFGKATLTLKPYFYPQNQLRLNAVGFEINEVAIIKGNQKTKAEYNYDANELLIQFNKFFARTDTIVLYVDYVAHPCGPEVRKGNVVTSDRGLFFINTKGEDPKKPFQIYTQSETQSASCWFPTIDAPNQRMTQEIVLTVDKKFTTLSNGLLEQSIENNNGTRSDYWRQNLPAAPYLSMIAIGEFSVHQSKWRDKEVSYYTEKAYSKDAASTFRNTPEMMEFFSKKLGVDFPWQKYAQIVVRDYPGGSMENTSATLHGEFMNITSRERLDSDKEEFISHELFHQWFGDLVTCESWSNTVLNEAFATYGEYLWLEYNNGKEEADIHHQQDLNTYLNESRSKQVSLIRYDYDDADELFDAHSYEKGGRVLHMLRNYVGDEAFFKALNLYLTKFKFSSVELADLRLCFEQVCGQDLNWFFNQWFLSPGHPELFITNEYNEQSKKQIVHIEQVQDQATTGLFRLPLAIDIYSFGKKERHSIVLNKEKDDFIFDVSAKPNWVNVDADKILLGKKNEIKSQEEWIFQYKNGLLYLDRYEAIDALSKIPGNKSKECMIKALSDKNWSIRRLAIDKLMNLGSTATADLKPHLEKLALRDEKSIVRKTAIAALGKLYDYDDLLDLYHAAADDPSYTVAAEALTTLYDHNAEQGFEEAKQFEVDSNYAIMGALISIYSGSGSDAENAYFLKMEPYFDGYSKYNFMQMYGKYLLGRSDSVINLGYPILQKTAQQSPFWWVRLAALQALDSLQAMYQEREKELSLIIAGGSKGDKATLIASKQRAASQQEKLREIFDALKAKETDKNILRFF